MVKIVQLFILKVPEPVFARVRPVPEFGRFFREFNSWGSRPEKAPANAQVHVSGHCLKPFDCKVWLCQKVLHLSKKRLLPFTR